MAPIALFARLTAKAASGQQLVDLLRELLPSVASNRGVHAFEIHAAEDDPLVIWVYELHTDRASLKQQDDTARVLLGERMEALLDGPPEIHEVNYSDGVLLPGGRIPQRRARPTQVSD